METTLNKDDSPEYCEPDNGGPAFPFSIPHGYTHFGMMLRDYFAAQALQGLLSSHGLSFDRHFIEKFAETSYLFADALLKQRG